jgi:hypothetical protein
MFPGRTCPDTECGLDLAAHWIMRRAPPPSTVLRHIGRTIRTTLCAHVSALGVCDQVAPELKLFKCLKAHDDLFVQVPSMPPAFSALMLIDCTTRVRAGASGKVSGSY